MQKHIKVYLEHYWLEQDQVLCEVCWTKAIDIHHIQPRSKFWKKTKHLQDDISNLIALCRHDHNLAHWIGWKHTKEYLQEIHNKNL